MVIAFWSPVSGKAGTTNNLFATSARMALKEKQKVLMINGQFEKRDLESAILPITEEMDLLNSIGIDCLIRNCKMRKVTNSTIRTAALAYYNEYLHVITGTTKENRELYEDEMLELFPLIIRDANPLYDFITIDVPSGVNKISKMMLDLAELVVINLPQNKNIIEEYFRDHKQLDKKTIYIIGNYSNKSKYNRKNLERIFKQLKDRTAVVTHNVDLMDAFSENSVIKYLQKDAENKKAFFNEIEKALYLMLKGGNELLTNK